MDLFQRADVAEDLVAYAVAVGVGFIPVNEADDMFAAVADSAIDILADIGSAGWANAVHQHPCGVVGREMVAVPVFD